MVHNMGYCGKTDKRNTSRSRESPNSIARSGAKLKQKGWKVGENLAVMTMATRLYVPYLLENIPRLALHLGGSGPVEILILTDSLSAKKHISEKISDFPNLIPRISLISSGSWEQLTLFRYELLSEVFTQLESETVLWMDADMQVVRDFKSEFFSKNLMVFCRHPGYELFTRNSAKKLLDPRFQRAFRRYITKREPWEIAYGAWERRQSSKAFVPVLRRSRYYAGGLWGGRREVVGTFLKEMTERTREDFRRGIVARWTDESHLNWYAAFRPHHSLPEGFMADQSFWNYDPARCHILAIPKENKT